MLNIENDDTIVALATPPQKCAIHIIRISGKSAYKVVNKITEKKIQRIGNEITYGWIINPDTKKRIDQVLFMKFVQKHSYTGEDLIEINCHGSLLIVRQILGLLIKFGGRIATRGEFTKRAFLNNKINLSQAGAVNELINSENLLSQQIAIGNLCGYSNGIFKKWAQLIYSIILNFELALDYPEYEEGQIDFPSTTDKLIDLKEDVAKIISESERSQKILSGIKIALVGKTNVGKSSIFNLLINETRSIVTDIPGTTRDIVTEKIFFNDYPVTFCDSAGIRETVDKVEIIGVDLSKELIKTSSLLIVVLDASSFTTEDKKIIDLAKDSKVPYITVVNKVDLTENRCNFFKVDSYVCAAKKNIKSLVDVLETKVAEIAADNSDRAVSSFMVDYLKKILLNLKKLIRDMKKRKYIDLLVIQLREIYQTLLDLTGENKNFDLVEKLFNDFCVGK